MHLPPVEVPLPLWAQLATAAGGLACMRWPRRLTRWTLRVVRERAGAARWYRLNGVSRLRALWLAVSL
jgi:hypothetical protein